MFALSASRTWLLLGSFFIPFIIHRVLKIREHNAIIRQKECELGCGKAKILACWDPFFNIDHFIQNIKESRRHEVLDSAKRFFKNQKAWTIKARILGQPLYFTAEPENVKAVLATNFKSYGIAAEREVVLGPFLGKGIFTSDGEEWKHSRNILRPSFARSELTDLDLFEPHVQALIRNIDTDSTIDLQPLFGVFAFDISTNFVLGSSTNCLTEGDEAMDGINFMESFDRCRAHISGEGKLGILGLFLPSWQSKKDVKTIQNFVDKFIERRSQEPLEDQNTHASQDFLNRLMSETDDRVKIRSEILNILLAGRDTSASALAIVWFCIARYPMVCQRIRAEIEKFNGRAPELPELQNLRYVKAVINEALRLYPIVPQNGKTAEQDTTIPRGGGETEDLPLFVSKGDLVAWDVYSMHRRKDIYGDDAEDFRPERWLDAENEKPLRPGWAYLPFHGGPRVCIGQQFALIQISYTTVRLLQAFSKVESRDDQPWTELLLLTCSSRNGCKVALSR